MSLGCVRLDKKYLTDNYIPSLKYIVDNEKSAAVTMCILGVYDSIAPIVGYDVLAVGVLPLLCPMLSDRNLNKEQYRMVLERVVKFLDIVSQHRAEDLDLHAVRLQITDSGSSTSIDNNMFGDARQISAPPPLPSLPAPSVPFSFPQDSAPGLPRSAPPSVPALAPPPVPMGSYTSPPPVPAAPPVPLTVSAKIVRGTNGLAPPVPASQPGFDASQIPTVAPPPPSIPSQTNTSSSAMGGGMSWFGSSVSPAASTYQPPLITLASGQNNVYNGSAIYGSSLPPMTASANSAALSAAAAPNDLDVGDFLSSFKNTSSGTQSQQMSISMGGMTSMQQSYSTNNIAATSGVMQAGAADLDMFLGGSRPAATGAIRPPPSNGMPTNQYQSSKTSPGNMSSNQSNSSSPASGFAFISNPQPSSSSLEDQIRRTQEEINKLSAGVATSSPGGYSQMGIPSSGSASSAFGQQQGGQGPRAQFLSQTQQPQGNMYGQIPGSFTQVPMQNFGQSNYAQTPYSQPNLGGGMSPYGSVPMNAMQAPTQPTGGATGMGYSNPQFPQQSYQGYGTTPGSSQMSTHQASFSNPARGPSVSSTSAGYRPPIIPPPRGSGTQSNPNDPFGLFK